ncbi:glycosyltransferase family 2 protein [Kineococcus rhizosphaerae]|uniref:Glycosyl transferase family 2 n=1 Tax=Kineococcus rhizosphaerae TaxID=559628 RepID=A0A2T0RB91_9ACTN|nr:glycosyltransferase [Kineococcus rhizosphaerae]PRY18438.1 glycosyl transferase family 2 [Kineococcus rhizosphaerae]
MIPLRAPEPVGPVEPATTAPSIAVVIAAYNASATISATLNSVFTQTLPPDEVVVCDDGSDDVEELRAALSPFGDRVRLVHVDHGGESRAKNGAVAATSSDVVCVLDADDLWEPRRLEAVAEALRVRPDLSFVTTDAWHVRAGRRVVRHYAVNDFPTDGQRSAILRSNFVFGHTAVRRSAWDDVSGFSEALTVGADWDCWLRLIYRGHLVGLVDEPLASYLLSPGSLSGNRARAMRARVLLLEKAAAEQTFSADEGDVLRQSLQRWGTAAVLAEADEAVRSGSADVRRRCLAVTRTPGVGARTRVKHALAAAAPGLARRRRSQVDREADDAGE